MYIKTLHLTNYRNHKNLHLDFSQDCTVIIGENGSGKTNIIEAINLLSIGRGFNASFDKEIINYQKEDATVKAIVIKDHTSSDLKVDSDLKEEAGRNNGGKNQLRIGISIAKSQDGGNKSIKTTKVNGKTIRIGDLSSIFNTVLFSPLEMNLLVNGPSARRDFLDNVLVQGDREYKKNLLDYIKVRRHKNKVLEIIRETNTGYSQLKFWNEKLTLHGKFLQTKRKDFFDYINENINNLIQRVDPKIETKIKYLINPVLEERLPMYQQREIAAATTLIGPHRDDFIFTTKEYGENQDYSRYASRGQQRTLILCLKLCELAYLTKKVGERPVLLLDDIFSELDHKHKEALRNVIGTQQTIITSTEIEKSGNYKNIITLR